MAEAKTKNEVPEGKEDIQFDRALLSSRDGAVADKELEKLNKPMPEQFRGDPAKLDGWPVPEDRLPAVMRADTADSVEYKLETYDKVPEEARDTERADGPGTVARAEYNKLVADTTNLDMNEIQAPPSPAAVTAAEGKGAQSAPIPVATPQQVTAARTGTATAPNAAGQNVKK